MRQLETIRRIDKAFRTGAIVFPGVRVKGMKQMQNILLGVAFVISTVFAVLALYMISRKLLWRYADDGTDALAGSMIFRISALHGLILALVFAQELQQYGELRLALTEEASAVADIWNDLARYNGPTRHEIQSTLTSYVNEVAGPEWTRLGEGQGLSAKAWKDWETVYEGVLALEPTSVREEALRNHMLDNARRIARLRDQRETESIYSLTPIFWLAAVAGVIFVVIPYFTFAPTVLHLSLLGIYAAYVGLIIHLIYAFTNPYEQPARLPPAAFERLLATEIGVQHRS